jgi:hypothetical protein
MIIPTNELMDASERKVTEWMNTVVEQTIQDAALKLDAEIMAP